MKTSYDVLEEVLRNGSTENMGTCTGHTDSDNNDEWANEIFGGKIATMPEEGFTHYRYFYEYVPFDGQPMFSIGDEDGILVHDDGTLIYLYALED